MSRLKVADNLTLLVDAVTETFGILAVRGAGKSNTAAVMAEAASVPASRDELIEAYKRHVLSDYEARLFDVLVAAHGRELTRETIAERACQSAKRSAFGALLASVRGSGLIEYGPGGTVRLAGGVLVSGDFV